MRVEKAVNSAGGKGINVARGVLALGGDALATGFVGGFNGEYFLHLLQKDKVSHSFEKVQAETRSCVNVLDQKFKSTEFLEPGRKVSEEEVVSFVKRFENLVSKSSLVVISGSVPAGVPKDFYAQLILICKTHGVRVFLDSSGDMLQEGMHAKPYFIKPNEDEIATLIGHEVSGPHEALKAAKEMQGKCADYVVVSMGAKGCVVACESGEYIGIAPSVEAKNTVGSGDSFVAGFAFALDAGFDDAECIKYALAAGAANAISSATGNIKRADFDLMFSKCKVQCA